MIFFIDDLDGMDTETTNFLEKWLSTSISGSIIWIGAVVDDIEVSDFWSKTSTFFSHMEGINLGENVFASIAEDVWKNSCLQIKT